MDLPMESFLYSTCSEMGQRAQPSSSFTGFLFERMHCPIRDVIPASSESGRRGELLRQPQDLPFAHVCFPSTTKQGISMISVAHRPWPKLMRPTLCRVPGPVYVIRERPRPTVIPHHEFVFSYIPENNSWALLKAADVSPGKFSVDFGQVCFVIQVGPVV